MREISATEVTGCEINPVRKSVMARQQSNEFDGVWSDCVLNIAVITNPLPDIAIMAVKQWRSDKAILEVYILSMSATYVLNKSIEQSVVILERTLLSLLSIV